MKAILTPLFLVMASHYAMAQVADQTYTDCDGNSESIYEFIGAGTPLLVASKGFDCSICMSQAAKVQTFASQYPAVRVWGAMNYKYSSATPECPALNNWRSSYAWNDIFMFNDVNDEWQAFGYPTYYVISPVDTTVVYQGPSFTAAEAAALALLPSGLPPAGLPDFEVRSANRALEVICQAQSCDDVREIIITGITGQKVMALQVQLQSGKNVITLAEKPAEGIYLVTFYGDSKMLSTVKVALK